MENKIRLLFEYRKLPELLSHGPYGWESPFVQKLIALQFAIYELDTYLESNWKISKTKLNEYWRKIRVCLSELGIPKAQHDDYLRHIQKYQDHELAMRNGKLPTDLSIEFYYFYKSCDVKLIRRIIYDYLPVIKKQYSLSDWRQFDLITEINDDIEDVYEDVDVINGNYFQIALGNYGKEETYEMFSTYLNKMKEQSSARYQKKDSRYIKKLDQWTQTYAKQTQRLLKQRIKELRLEEIRFTPNVLK